MSLLLENTVKVSLIVIAAMTAIAVFRHRSAALRHWMLAMAVVCAVLAPAFRPIAPSWTVPLDPALGTPQAVEIAAPGGSIESGPAASSASGLPSTVRPTVDWGLVAGWAWLAGAVVSLSILGVGLARLVWIAARSKPVPAGRWSRIAADLASRQDIRRPVRLLQHDQSALLVTWGFFRPDIILPSGASEWSDDRIRIVLLHELAHIRRGDWATQIVAECLRAVYWFNPLVWLASARLRQESEQACDDAVLADGVEAPDYATHLLDLARAFKTGRRTFVPAPAMARPSSLERRFTVMLNNATNRNPLTRPARLATTIAVLTASILIAGFGAAQSFFTFSGSVFDSTNRVIPRITVTLINPENQSKYSIQSDGTGRFQFVGLPPGDYLFEASGAGFSTLKGKVTVNGRDVQRDLSLEVGSLEETITVRASVSGDSAAPTRPRRVESPKAREPRVPPPCGGTIVGGNIKPPMKLVDVRPDYPENLRATGTGGVVTLAAVIGTDGAIRNVDVVNAPYPDLGVAAVEAVRQWEFSQTLLNCEPIEVKMKVTVNFQVQQ
jgi:TonB family protein